MVSSQKAPDEGLSTVDALHEISFLPLHVGFLIIVFLPANRAGLFLTFKSHEPLEAIQAFLMEHMGAA